MHLDLLLRARQISAWEPQVRFPLVVNGVKVCTYVADFKVTHLDGSVEVQETKGYGTDVAKLKVALFPPRS